MTDKKSNIVILVSTAVFAVLSVCLMFTFKLNEDYFDTHGRISALAGAEQENILLESAKASAYKSNINFSIIEEQNEELILDLSPDFSIEQVSIRDEFTSHKLVLTLENAAALVQKDNEIIADANVMEAVGLYTHEEDVVLEIYTKEAYGVNAFVENGKLTVKLLPLEELYDYLAVIYVPFEDKDRLYSEEWIQALNAVLGDRSKLYLTSSMQETYSEQEVLEFANAIKADIVMGVDFETTIEPEYAEIIYNGSYFIPNFGSTDLAVKEKQYFEEKTNIGIREYIEAGDKDILVLNAKEPAALIRVYAQTENEDIEDKYTLNHSIMEALTAIFKELRTEE